MEHLASLEERDKAGVFLNRVHWPPADNLFFAF